MATFAFVSVLFASTARAQTSDAALAQSLFEKGRQLMATQHYKEACPLFAESQRLDPGGGTLLNLAICHEGEGKLATAWSEFNEALSGAIKDGRKGREQIAREHIVALEPKLSHVTVVVPPSSEVSGLTLTLDGIELAKPAWGVPTAVDAGTHRVEANAPGFPAWSVLVNVGGGADSQKIEVPALRRPPSGVLICPGDLTFNGESCVPPAAAPVLGVVSHPLGVLKPLSPSPLKYVVGALSVGALGTSLVTGILAWSDHTTVSDHCDVDRNYCDGQDAIDKRSQMRTWAWVSTIALGTGVVAAGAYVFWPHPTRSFVGAKAVTGGAEVVVGGAL